MELLELALGYLGNNVLGIVIILIVLYFKVRGMTVKITNDVLSQMEKTHKAEISSKDAEIDLLEKEKKTLREEVSSLKNQMSELSLQIEEMMNQIKSDQETIKKQAETIKKLENL